MFPAQTLVFCLFALTNRPGGGGNVRGADESEAMRMGVRDMALVWDRELRGHVAEFADDEESFAHAFAQAFQKLEEMGVDAMQPPKARRPWYYLW